MPGTPIATQPQESLETSDNYCAVTADSGHASAKMAPGLWSESRGRGPRVVFLHGFTQAGKSWDPVLKAATGLNIETVLPDLPGHGRSSRQKLHLNDTADLLAQSFGPAAYVGYSMGGRVALHVALRHPGLVRGLLLFGATPGLDSEQDRIERRCADEKLAQDIEAIGVPAFLERWLSSPLFATLPRTAQDLTLREQNTVEGLASSLRLSGTGTQASLWPYLNTIRIPTIVAAGDRDQKFTQIGNSIVERIGDSATFATVVDAGHSCHVEQPDKAADLLRRLLSECTD